MAADNVNITPGSGATVAADSVLVDGTHAEGLVQFVKLVDGTLNGTEPIATDVGAKLNAMRVAPANDITDATYIGDIKFGEAEPNSAAIKTAVELIDNAISGSEMQVDIVASLPAGTNAIGKLAANSGVDIGDVTLTAGTAAIGKLAANTGVDIGDVDVTSVITGVGATNLGKARDSALGATDTGVMALAVRDDTLTTLTPADGDYVPLRVSSTGQLHVTGGGGGTQYNIDTVLGGAATTTLAGVVRDDSLTTLTEADGDVSVLRVSSTGQLHVTGGGGGTEYTEDVATANPQVGSAVMMERDDALTTVTPVEADWIGLRGTAEGALWTQDFNSDAILSDTSSIDGKITACNTGAVVVSSGTITANLGATDNAVLDQIELNTDPLLVVGGGAEATAIRVTIANDSTGVVSIDDGGGTLTVDGTVTANLSATDNAVLDAIDAVLDTINAKLVTGTVIGDVNLGATDNAVLDAIAASLVTIDSDTNDIKTATEIMDDWDATHASAAPTDGVCIMGAGYSAALPTDVGADADAARICTDRHGRVLSGVMPQNFQATFTSADAQAATPVKTKTADRKMYILSLVVSVDTAMNVQFQDDTGPTILIEGMYFAANGGAHLTWPPEAPLVVNTNEDFDVITSAAGNISVTITGYLAV